MLLSGILKHRWRTRFVHKLRDVNGLKAAYFSESSPGPAAPSLPVAPKASSNADTMAQPSSANPEFLQGALAVTKAIYINGESHLLHGTELQKQVCPNFEEIVSISRCL